MTNKPHNGFEVPEGSGQGHCDGAWIGAKVSCPQGYEPIEQRDNGRWYITIGHPGFNLPANNGSGYVSRGMALRHQARCAARSTVFMSKRIEEVAR